MCSFKFRGGDRWYVRDGCFGRCDRKRKKKKNGQKNDTSLALPKTPESTGHCREPKKGGELAQQTNTVRPGSNIRFSDLTTTHLNPRPTKKTKRPRSQVEGEGVSTNVTPVGFCSAFSFACPSTQCIQPLFDLFGSSCKTVIPLTLSSLDYMHISLNICMCFYI